MNSDRFVPVLGLSLLGCLVGLFGACSTPTGPNVGTQTNWLRVCEMDADCGTGNRCLCSTCTRIATEDDAVCDELPSARRVESDHPGAIALCNGELPPADALCLVSCEDSECPKGSRCVADICAPDREPTVHVAVDIETTFQTLVGFGAAVSYNEAEITNHPAKPRLYDAMFADSGFDVLRLRNLYVATEEPNFTHFKEIVDAATQRMSQPPLLFLSSGSPPASLKQNGSTYCDGNPDTCTLTKNADGDFDYAALALHFRESLEAYATAGINPDYLSIQNDPNYVPPAGRAIETCRFLPQEGTDTIVMDGVEMEVEYAGYSQALDAVMNSIAELSPTPKIAGPEATGVQSSRDFIDQMDLTHFDALAHHMYGVNALDPNRDELSDLATAGKDSGLQLFQTEMAGSGLETAMLVQEALADIGATMYLQTTFVAPASVSTPDTGALIALTADDFVIQDPYLALKHFAENTEPGWTRVEVTLDIESVRGSAWLSPDGARLTVILVNPLSTEEVVALDLDESLSASSVTRTVFTGLERYAKLGELSSSDSFVLPGNAVMTVTFDK